MNKQYTGMLLVGQTLHLYERGEDMRADMAQRQDHWSKATWLSGVEFHHKAEVEPKRATDATGPRYIARFQGGKSDEWGFTGVTHVGNTEWDCTAFVLANPQIRSKIDEYFAKEEAIGRVGDFSFDGRATISGELIKDPDRPSWIDGWAGDYRVFVRRIDPTAKKPDPVVYNDETMTCDRTAFVHDLINLIEQTIQLPLGYKVRIEPERANGGITIWDKHGECHVASDSNDDLVDRYIACINEARRRQGWAPITWPKKRRPN